MKRHRFIPLLVGMLVTGLLTVPGIALASNGHNQGGDRQTGNACPPATDNSDRSPPPGCGQGGGGGGTGGTGGTGGGNTANACPPATDNSDRSPPPGCGHGTDNGTNGTGNGTTNGTNGTGNGTTNGTNGTTNGTDNGTDSTTSGTTGTTSTTSTTTTAGGADPCTAAAGDPGILTDDTLAQTLYDGGLSALPIVQDPDADGPISGPIYTNGNGTPLEPLTDEVACLINLPVLDL